MASINISLKREAYDFLKNMKRKDKSFSDVVLSFKKESDDVMRFFGALKDLDWEKKEKDMKNFRHSFSKRLR